MISCLPITPPFSPKPPPHFPEQLNLSQKTTESCLRNGAKYRSLKQIRKSIIIPQKVKSHFCRFTKNLLFRPTSAKFLLALLLALLPALILAGCVRQDGEGQIKNGSADTAAIHQIEEKSHIVDFTAGNLQETNVKSGDTIYINAHDANGQSLSLPKKLEAQALGNFSIAKNPSKASHILHITVLSLGPASEASLKTQTATGYDSSAILSGRGGTAILADALLVSRILHNEKKEKTTFLKNVSARNTRESAQMRIGVYINQPPSAASTAILEERLAKIIGKALE